MEAVYCGELNERTKERRFLDIVLAREYLNREDKTKRQLDVVAIVKDYHAQTSGYREQQSIVQEPSMHS